jgi:hypothetical protein
VNVTTAQRFADDLIGWPVSCRSNVENIWAKV